MEMEHFMKVKVEVSIEILKILGFGVPILSLVMLEFRNSSQI